MSLTNAAYTRVRLPRVLLVMAEKVLTRREVAEAQLPSLCPGLHGQGTSGSIPRQAQSL